MQKKKSIIALFVILAMVLAIIPFKVFAAPSETEKASLVEIKLRKATDVAINNGKATITYENGRAEVTANGLQYDKKENQQVGMQDGNPIYGDMYYLYTTDTTVTFNLTPASECVAQYWVGGRPNEVENNTYEMSNLQVGQGKDQEVEFTFENVSGGNGGEGETPQPVVNTTATVNISAGTGTWTETRYENGQEHEVETPYDTNIEVFINGVSCNGGGSSIAYDDRGRDTVDFTFETMWHEKFYEDIVINGETYNVSDYLDFDDRDQWLIANHGSQTLSFTIEGVEKKDTYNIVVKHGGNNGKRYFANFLWTADPDQADGPNYIGNSKLEFVKAVYEVGGTTYTVTGDQINGNIVHEGEHDNYHSEDGFLTYGTTAGVSFDDGALTLPGSSEITMRVVPDYGYQVTSVNGNYDFSTTDDGVSLFTLKLPEEFNGYFTATVEKVDNTVTPTSEKVKSGDIELGENAATDIKNGTVRLSVEDIELSSDKITDFQEKASEAGDYTISNYLDINLDKVLYRGTSDSVWSEQIHHLTDKALITLQLEEGVDANNIVIVHNIDNGDEFEIIQIESYDPETNTITFYTDSFSNYAIATKGEESTADEQAKTESTDSVKTGDKIMIFAGIFLVATIALVVTKKSKRSRRVSKH